MAAGVTVTEPEGTGCGPTPWLMVSDVACSVPQESVELWPAIINAGVATRLVISGGGWFTVMVTDRLAVPFGLNCEALGGLKPVNDLSSD